MIRYWPTAVEAPQNGAEAHGRKVVFVEASGNVHWTAANDVVGVSTLERWADWETTGDELVRR